MSDTAICKNRVNVAGTFVSGLEFSHSVRKESFYLAYISVMRRSGKADILPVMFSEKIIDVTKDYSGSFCRVTGQYRSYRRNEIWRSMLTFLILAGEVSIPDDMGPGQACNEIYLSGFVSRPAIYRMTPRGRNVTDLFLTVRRPHGKIIDHIPCIAWGSCAKALSGIEPSTYMDVWGRIESREYIKNTEDAHPQKHMAYEVCINRFEIIRKPAVTPEDETESRETAVDNS